MPKIILFASAIVCALAGCAGASGTATTTPVSGIFNNSQENACIHVSTFFYLTDCSYARTNPDVAGQTLPWTGPTVNPVYYALGSAHASPDYTPVPGDDRISPTLEGTLTIDDQGTPDPLDDSVSGLLVVGPTARSVVANVSELAGGPAGKPPRSVMSWSSITHTLAATNIDSASVNEHGGFDYVIASKGFPTLICRTDDPHDCFPSADAGKTTDGQLAEGTWSAPGSVGVTRDTAMAGNAGAATTATMADYVCVDNVGGITCPDHNVVWGSSTEDPGLDNLLLRIATNDKSEVVDAQGFWTNEYRINGGPDIFQLPEGHDNSWQGGYLRLHGVAAAITE